MQKAESLWVLHFCVVGDTGGMTILSTQVSSEEHDEAAAKRNEDNKRNDSSLSHSAMNHARASVHNLRSKGKGAVVLAATPIGNVGDASARLISLLESADIVAAEDTRRLYDLANRLGIRVKGRVSAYHDHNERVKADGLLDEVDSGAILLVVSDAGMPTINDPGLTLVRRAIERGLPITCAPGPSAVLDALALSGLPTDRFCYEGFVPRKHTERLQRFRSLLSETRTIVFYETPHRIQEAMDDLESVFGSARPMVLARELTKDYEEVRRASIDHIREGVIAEPPRGELVLVIQGASAQEVGEAAEKGIGTPSLSTTQLAQLALKLAEDNKVRLKVAIAKVAAEHPLLDGSFPNKKAIYAASLELKGQSNEE